MIARPDQQEAVAHLHREVAGRSKVRLVGGAELERMVPLIRPGYAVRALYEENARDIDVHALHQGYLRGFKAAGGVVRTDCEIRALQRDGGSWRVSASGGDFGADIVVNAAGAWADEIAGRAGVPAIGLVPKRRTALIVAAPDGVRPNAWPMVVDVDERFYLKPDAGRLLVSPADETPSPPCDAQPEDIDVAVCVDRIQRAFDLEVRRIENKWAGLRSFVADKTPVVGYDPDVPGFFWLAGQGGYGIQSAPALARMAAAILERRPVPAFIADQGVDETALMPRRPELAA
jgi:D-arginine dehydrogenase